MTDQSLPESSTDQKQTQACGRPGEQSARHRSVVLRAVLTLAASVVVLWLVSARNKHQVMLLGTPEDAMHGIARVNAGLRCLGTLAVATAGLSGLALVHALRRHSRALIGIPAVTIVVLYSMYRSTLVGIEAVPALRANFVASEISLDEFVDAILKGENPTLPQHVGRFEFIAYERLANGAIVLITKKDDFFKAEWGFVRCPDQIADKGPATLVGIPAVRGDEHLVKRISGRWFILFHHYLFIKRGWS